MKNSKEYAQKVKTLYKALKKEAKPAKNPGYSDPVESLIFAAICQTEKESTTRTIIKKLQSHFVDKNDLRVSRNEEILEVIGKDSAKTEKIATDLTTLLNSVFQKYDMVSLEEIGLDGKRIAKEILESFNGMNDFVCAYVMLTALDAHAIPLTSKMIEYLRSYGLVDEKATDAEIGAFLERQIAAADAYTFYSLLRHDAESSRPKAKTLLSKSAKKVSVKKKAVKKTKKKKTKK